MIEDLVLLSVENMEKVVEKLDGSPDTEDSEVFHEEIKLIIKRLTYLSDNYYCKYGLIYRGQS